MKTFKDLEFTERKWSEYLSKRASMEFKNEYGISVIAGFGAQSSDSQPYEIAVLYKDTITYNTPVADDVVGYLTEDEVTGIMNKIQKLK